MNSPVDSKVFIGLAPFSFRSLTLEWFRVSFFGLSFRLILLCIPNLGIFSCGFPFSDPVPVIDTCLFSGISYLGTIFFESSGLPKYQSGSALRFPLSIFLGSLLSYHNPNPLSIAILSFLSMKFYYCLHIS